MMEEKAVETGVGQLRRRRNKYPPPDLGVAGPKNIAVHFVPDWNWSKIILLLFRVYQFSIWSVY